MVFSSLTFLCLFLPLAVIPYYLCKNRTWRNGLLLVLSLFFYSWGEPKYVVMMLAATVVAYLGGLAMAAWRDKPRARRAVFVVTVVLVVLNLLVFKYLNFFWDNLTRFLPVQGTIPEIALPIGISFYTFQILSYVIDLYRGKVKLQRNFFYLLLYISFFPQLIAGPIVRYSTIEEEILHRRESWEDVAEGLRRFILGLGKKVILANGAAAVAELIYGGNPEIYGTAMYWLAAFAYTMQIYFDFSGYSDMAIGLGKIFGFDLLENFNYPFISRSVSEFWRRWHMSLGGWFRDYLYIPLGGNRVSKRKWVRNILVVWMLTGLWHGAAWNFVLWGLLFAALLMMEKALPGLQRLPGVLRHGYVLLAVILSFVLFNADTLAQAGNDFSALFGLAELPLFTAETGYYLRSYAPALVIACIGATPLVKQAAQKIGENRAFQMLEPVLWLGLLLVCTAYLVDGSFSPFLYFRF